LIGDTDYMSIATQDDLECYLSSGVRVVSVDNFGSSLDELLHAVDATTALTIRHPAPDEDITEWCGLLIDLEPQILVVSHNDRLLDRANFAQMSTRQMLLRGTNGMLSYQWTMIGDRITLVITGSDPDAVRNLSSVELRKLGALLKGLLTAR
jgi:hypothetical protein